MRCSAITAKGKQCKMEAGAKSRCVKHRATSQEVVAPVFWNTCPMCNHRFQSHEQDQEYCSYSCASGGGKPNPECAACKAEAS